MGVLGDLLFNRRDGVTLDDALRHRGDVGVQRAVDALSESEFRAASDDALIKKLVDQLQITPLVLQIEKAKASVTEVTVTVVDVFEDRARVPGLRAEKVFPFTGDAELWELRPNPFDMNPPHGDVNRDSLTLGMEVLAQDGEQAAIHIQQAIKRVQEYLSTQALQIATFNSKPAVESVTTCAEPTCPA